MASSYSTVCINRNLRYDVFLSFRGEDTRQNFISHLYDALDREGIETFDDMELRRGEEIGPALVQGIKESKIAVVIFSKGYASSTWCLDELARIIECHEMYGLIVIPVFYRVTPSNVRKQSGSFVKAFAKHKKDPEKLHKVRWWKAALRKASNLSGWDSDVTRPDSKLVDAIVKDVRERSKQVSPNVAENLVADLRTKQISIKLSDSQTKLISIECSGARGLRICCTGQTVSAKFVGGCSNDGSTSCNCGLPQLSSGLSRLATFVRCQISKAMRLERSATSLQQADTAEDHDLVKISSRLAGRAEHHTVAELAAATNDFSLENKIGAGSFGIVYKGKLADGREVAIKKGATGQYTRKFQEIERAFESELAVLSRLHHKHVVRLLGYCEDGDERLLVYEDMKNGSLYDHLHEKNNSEKSSSVINSWEMRIKIALDAARGIEYLHNYAVPPIIHRDIKSSNILLDLNWTARVSDFGLSVTSPESGPMMVVGTLGYIDPEYYRTQVSTAKSDVYGFGVVLLELLTGKRAIFRDVVKSKSVVDFALPKIVADDVVDILDMRIGPPETVEVVSNVAYLAADCLSLNGKDRPTMNEIVDSLERAFAGFDCVHGNISSDTISNISEDILCKEEKRKRLKR